jgi:HAD superfamily hydrolase (TIGR01509 family)
MGETDPADRAAAHPSAMMAPVPPDLPAAVLWDLDGTLVDTEPYWMASEFDVVAAHGGTWTLEHARAIVGFDLLDAAAYIRQHGRVPLEPAEIVERLLDGVVARLAVQVPWRPGACELLDELRGAGIPCALVTMSWRRSADPVVGALPPGTFSATITGDQVRHGKPHPEPYLAAAAALGVEPRSCVVLEDSPTGVASAEAAGCTVVVVPNVVDVPNAPGRHRVSSLTELDVAEVRRIAGLGRAVGPP